MTTTIYYMIFYCLIYSIVGWGLESIYRSIREKKIINSGFMHGPYCPIYGFGAIIMIVVLGCFKTDITLLFIVSFTVLSLWEYLVGWTLEKIYHTKYWDYSDHNIHFNGRICLTNSIYWGILGVLFTKIVHPLIASCMQMVPINVIRFCCYFIGSVMILDFVISNVKINSISRKILEIKTLGEKIVEKLKVTTQGKNSNKKENVEIPEDNELKLLQLRYNKLKVTLYKQLTRTRKAFPTMQSEIVNKFLSEKINVKELKLRIKAIKNNLKISSNSSNNESNGENTLKETKRIRKSKDGEE